MVSGPQASMDMGQRPDAGPNVGYLLFFFFILLDISRNSYNIPKFIENKIKLLKMQNKFLWNPFMHIYAINLTKFTFDLYCHL
jgi:hypothetical protein